MTDQNKDGAESLSDVFSGSETSQSSGAADITSETDSKSSTDSSEDKSSPSDDGAEKLPNEKEEKSSDEAAAPSKGEKTGEEKSAKDKAEDKTTPEKPKDGSEKTADPNDLPFKQRFEETQKWAQGLSQQNAQLQRVAEQQAKQLEILKKKVDGTWTDEDEAALHAGESTENVASRAVQTGKAIASRAAAIREFGAETVNNGIAEYRQLFAENAAVQMAIAESESPVHEALNVVERYHFQEKYGSTPKEWVANITKEAKASLEKELRKSILEEIRAGKSKRESTPETLAGGGGESGAENSKLKEENAAPLSKLFD